MTLEDLIKQGNDAMEKKDWRSAYQAWSSVHQSSPDHAWTKAKLGRIHLELNELEEAERFLVADAEAFPDRPFALANLAKVALKQKKWREARIRWEVVLEKFPDYEWAYQPYAEILKDK